VVLVRTRPYKVVINRMTSAKGEVSILRELHSVYGSRAFDNEQVG
jgi:hypothetical protein